MAPMKMPAEWATSLVTTRRLVLLLAFLLLVVGLLTACTSPQPAGTPDSIDIISTATSNEPLPVLPKRVAAEVTSLAEQSAAPGDAVVRVISSGDGMYEQDVTPTRGSQVDYAASSRGQKIRKSVDELNHHLAATTASVPGLDLLRLLDHSSTVPGSRTYVISSGLSTEAPLDFRSLGFDFQPDRVADAVAQQGDIPDLAGRHVTFIGLGIVAGSQAVLPPFARQKIEQLWITLCTRAKAASCDVQPSDGDNQQPVAALPVPVVAVPAVITEGGCPVSATLSDTTLHFAGDSAVLGDEANTVLQPIVTQLRTCDLVVDVAGNIADTGNEDPQNLSQQRANAVADRLVALGLPPRQLGEVVGRGVSQPVVPDLVNGVFDEGKAQLNRRTELTFHHLTTR